MQDPSDPWLGFDKNFVFSVAYMYEIHIKALTISLSHIMFNHDPGFRYTLIPSVGIRVLIESMCNKSNPFIIYMYI